MAANKSRVSRRTVIKTGSRLAAGAAAASTMGFPGIISWAGTKKLLKPIVAGLNAPAGDPSYNSIAYIPRILREKYDIEVEIQIHPSSTLGTDVSHLELVQTGFIDITSHGQSQWGALTDAWVFLDLPYAITDFDMAFRVLDSDLFKRQAMRMESQLPVKVLRPTGASGFRMLHNNKRPLQAPADNNGIKYRTTGSPVEIDLIKSWGGNPTPIAWTETYTSLRQGVVDGIHVQPFWTFRFKMHEVLKYSTRVDSSFAVQIQVMNINTFNSMPEEIQGPFLEAAKEAGDLGHNEDRALYDISVQNLTDAGMDIYQPSAAEMKLWRELGESVWEKHPQDREVLDGLRTLRGTS